MHLRQPLVCWLCSILVLLFAILLSFGRISSVSVLINNASVTNNSMDITNNRNKTSWEVEEEKTSNASESLRPLTDHEERQYNQFARKMSYFHTYLQEEYETAYELADGTFNKRGMSLETFLNSIDQFIMHLNTHHDIEERHIFPILAQRMPEFRPNERHKTSHKLIHDGLDLLEATVQDFQENPQKYKPEVLRNALDSFRDVLYQHLAEEVRDLSAENMRKYWTIAELARIPF